MSHPPLPADRPAPPPEARAARPSACDVLVVGGGINGVGIARDLAGRGVSVLLCEKDDLAAHTSSSSTKLIHGGLRYLEHYEFGLVRKALAEREVLLRAAPHIMWPLRFVMPHDPAMRPVWMIRIGLFLYDHLARREMLPASHTVDLRDHIAGAPLKPGFSQGFVYSDGWVDDARLVVLNAVDAARRGATVATRCRCVDARRGTDHWDATLEHADGTRQAVRARMLVNAAGPWAAQFLADHAHAPRRHALRLVKGSHIVVPKLFEHPFAYIFQNPDGRIIFAIPYERDFTLIGTTDVEHHGAIGDARIDADEVAYLCAQASRYFARPVTPSQVVWTYSGVRPLLDDESGNPAQVTRDYELERSGDGIAQAPLLSVWGGKLTTFRKLAEEAADHIAARLGASRGPWTADAALPGGAFDGASAIDARDLLSRIDGAVARLHAEHPDVPEALCRRLVRAYGTEAPPMLAQPRGAQVAPGLYERELAHLHDVEWARSADDVLWRRTKLGLHFDAAQRDAVAAWCRTHWGDAGKVRDAWN